MKVDGSLGSLLQGVSQQPARDRFDGQCSLQENMSSDPVNGLARRPPTDLVGQLASEAGAISWHNFETRDGNKFLAMFSSTAVRVYDLNANAQSVTASGGDLVYVSNSGNIKCDTDDKDNTVVLNTNVNVLMTSSAPVYFNTNGAGAMVIQVLGGLYSTYYSIYINGALASRYLTVDNTHVAGYLTTSNICARLVQGLLGPAGTTNPDPSSELISTGFCAGWENVIIDGLAYLRAPAGNFTASCTDGTSGANLKIMTDTVTEIGELPRIAPHWYVARIAENTDPEKDLWFKFIVSELEASITPSGTAFGKPGYWKEAVKPGVDTKFNLATMPHKLVYNNPGFTFSSEAYVDRGVGTTVSNPNPSFVGNKINDVSAFQGRIVFLAGSNVIMSRTNKSTNFWRGSASALADTDPIDINSTSESSQMLAAVQFNKDLAVFSPKGQYVVFGRTGVTPANAALVRSTSFEGNLDAHPRAAGRNVLFATQFGRYSGMREFFADGNTDANDAREITQHVNKYIVGNAQLITASSTIGTALVHTDTEQTDVYAYQYVWSDQKKVQSSWSTWTMSADMVYSFFDKDIVYIVQKRGTDYYLLRMPMDVQDSEGIDYAVYLDQRFDVPDCNTSFDLPFNYLGDEELVCVQGEGCPNPGLTVAITSIDVVGPDRVVTLHKDMEGGNLVCGTRYLSRYMPTMPSSKDQAGQVIGTAKLRAKSLSVTLDDTGELTGIVRSPYGDGPPVVFDAHIVGGLGNIVGEPVLSNVVFNMPFRQNTTTGAEIEFYTDSHMPMGISNIEYVGQYNKRGRRIANSGGAKE